MLAPSQVRMIIAGIDPGLSGALAFYNTATGDVETIDMPTLTVGKTSKRRIDEHQLQNIFWQRHAGHAFVELVALRPKESGTSALTIGIGYGIIRGVLAAVGVPFTIVTSKSWKAALGVTGDKDNSRSRANQLLPQACGQWPLKKHDGRAEAALLCVYGARSLAGISNPSPLAEMARDLPDDTLDTMIDEAAER